MAEKLKGGKYVVKFNLMLKHWKKKNYRLRTTVDSLTRVKL